MEKVLRKQHGQSNFKTILEEMGYKGIHLYIIVHVYSHDKGLLMTTVVPWISMVYYSVNHTCVIHYTIVAVIDTWLLMQVIFDLDQRLSRLYASHIGHYCLSLAS